MTNQELQIAQSLYGASFSMTRHAQKLDPKRQHATPEVRALDNIARAASRTLYMLCGRDASECEIFDFSTDTPAPWAKSVKGWTYGQEQS